MSYACLDCGAIDNGDGTCRDFFDSFLNLEFTNSEYGEVHALTDGIYMIQHYRYSDDALVWIRESLKQYLDKNWHGGELRKNADLNLEMETAKPKILRTINDPRLPKIKWTMTIADVAAKYDGAESYRDLIRQWATTTLLQLDELPG